MPLKCPIKWFVVYSQSCAIITSLQFYNIFITPRRNSRSSVGKESAYNAEDPSSIPGLGRFPWRRKWQPTPVFLPGESHGQRCLAGYSP